MGRLLNLRDIYDKNIRLVRRGYIPHHPKTELIRSYLEPIPTPSKFTKELYIYINGKYFASLIDVIVVS